MVVNRLDPLGDIHNTCRPCCRALHISISRKKNKTAEPQWEKKKRPVVYNVRPIYFEDRAIPVPVVSRELYGRLTSHGHVSRFFFFFFFFSMHNVERPTVCRGQKGMYRSWSRNEFCSPLGIGFVLFVSFKIQIKSRVQRSMIFIYIRTSGSRLISFSLIHGSCADDIMILIDYWILFRFSVIMQGDL